MSKFAIQYRKQRGEHGSWIIEETGLCHATDASGIEANVVTRYKLIPIPNANGVILKVLDGSSPAETTVRPATYSLSYQCVKVFGGVEPFSPAHDGGVSNNVAILFYTIRWQQVGRVA